jgi:hypothetical protein
MDAPFVYNAMQDESPAQMVSQLRLAPVPNYRLGEVLPPPEAGDQSADGNETASPRKPHKRSVFRRVGSFFAGIFH